MEENYALTPEELKKFHENGFIGPFTLYSPEKMEAIWKSVRQDLHDRSHAAYKSDIGFSGITNISNYDRHLDINVLSDHICKPQIVQRVRSILGDNVLCWRSEFFPKYKGDEGTDWHQADTFANASGSPQILWPPEDHMKSGQGTITVWTAFTDSTIKNGCLQFIPGTHKTMHYDETKPMDYDPDKVNALEKDGSQRGFFGYDYRDLQLDPDWRPNESDAVSMEMKAGQFIIFWSTLMHASHPHRSTARDMRMGYVARYVPARVRVYPDTDVVSEYGGEILLDHYGAVLVSGKDEYKHNKLVRKNNRGHEFTS